jgi:hypothetical protein
MALIILPLVLLKVFGVFVDGVVCKMHIKVTKITTHWWHILRSCKTSESFLINENSERSYACYQYVDTEIEF